MTYYFAYGSNMDENDFEKWCAGNNRQKKIYPMPKFNNKCPAELKGYRLDFNYRSDSRNGGAANIMKSDGYSVYVL